MPESVNRSAGNGHGAGPHPLPRRRTLSGAREFAFFPAAVVAFVVNDREEFLLLRHPKRAGWESVSGALEDGETVLAGACREVAEEAGPDVSVLPLGTVHASSFHYDEQVPFMISVMYLMRYIEGPIMPGDDMQGSEWGWFGIDRILSGEVPLLAPPGQPWLYARALDLFRLWRSENARSLQPDLSEATRARCGRS